MGIGKAIAVMVLGTCVVPGLPQTHPASKPRQAPAQERQADDLKEAEDLLQKEQYPQAESLLQAYVGKQTENPQAWFDLGFAQGRLGKNPDAILAYKKAAALSPKWFEAQQNLGLALAKSGDLPAAASALKIAVTLKPSAGGQTALVRAWLALAQTEEDSQPQDALAAYKKAVELDPANAEAQLGMAKMAERSGDAATAEQQYLKLATAGNQESLEHLINLYLQQKRYSDAETWLRKYMTANPGNTAAQLQLGKLLAAEGKSQEAIAALEPVYNATPDPKIARELAALYVVEKKYDLAAKLLPDLLQHAPADAQLHLDYGNTLMHLNRYPEAQAELLKAVQIKPGLAEAYLNLGYAAEQNKNYELTLRALDARARLQPDTPATYFLRATAYDNLKMFKPAAENYKLFLAAAAGKFPDQEFQARHRLKAIQPN